MNSINDLEILKKNYANVNQRVEKTKKALIILLIFQVFIFLLKYKMSLFHMVTELLGIVILIIIIRRMSFCDCVIHSLVTLCNLFGVLMHMAYYIQTFHRTLKLYSPQVMICYACIGFYTISLTLMLQSYRISKLRSLKDLMSESIASSEKENKQIQQDKPPQLNQQLQNNKSNLQNYQAIKQLTQQTHYKQYVGLFSNLANQNIDKGKSINETYVSDASI